MKTGWILKPLNVREVYWLELMRRRLEESAGTVTDQVDAALDAYLRQ